LAKVGVQGKTRDGEYRPQGQEGARQERKGKVREKKNPPMSPGDRGKDEMSKRKGYFFANIQFQSMMKTARIRKGKRGHRGRGKKGGKGGVQAREAQLGGQSPKRGAHRKCPTRKKRTKVSCVERRLKKRNQGKKKGERKGYRKGE